MNTNSTSVNTAAGLVIASRKAYGRKWSYLVLFVLVLSISISAASALDVLPDAKKEVAAEPKAIAAAPLVAIAAPEQPTKLVIPAIKLSQKVSNPISTDVEVLDRELLSGTVRYPSSANLGEQGNVIIFGHSSYLPIVHNKAYKALDGIQNLKQGDRIEVTGSSHTYIYAVESVGKASATEDSIPLDVEGSKLTLATCDSFGEKTDRFIVTATLIETDAL